MEATKEQTQYEIIASNAARVPGSIRERAPEMLRAALAALPQIAREIAARPATGRGSDTVANHVANVVRERCGLTPTDASSLVDAVAEGAWNQEDIY